MRASTGRLVEQPQSLEPAYPLRRLAGIALCFAFVSALPWLAKNIASPRYADQSQAALEKKIASLSGAGTKEEIDSFASQPGAIIQTGRVLYPRFFSRENGLASANPWPAYALREYPRIGFMLLNQASISVVFPTRRLPEFPHAQDAIIVGCQRADYVEARWVFFPALNSVYATQDLAESCST